MEKKLSFWVIILSVGLLYYVVILCIIESAVQNSEHNKTIQNYDPIHYFEKPKSYENKKETSFMVYDVLDSAAVAQEISDGYYDAYFGKEVLIRGEDFYDEQIINVKNPQIVGTYQYNLNRIPVIEGEME